MTASYAPTVYRPTLRGSVLSRPERGPDGDSPKQEGGNQRKHEVRVTEREADGRDETPDRRQKEQGTRDHQERDDERPHECPAAPVEGRCLVPRGGPVHGSVEGFVGRSGFVARRRTVVFTPHVHFPPEPAVERAPEAGENGNG